MSLGPGPTRAGGLYASESSPGIPGGCGGFAAFASLGTQSSDIDVTAPVGPSAGAALCISSPKGVPSSSSAYGVGVRTQKAGIAICGLFVSCTETGVTLISGSSPVNFYSDTNTTGSFSTPGGPGGECPSDGGHTYSSGSGSTGFDNPFPLLKINVTQTS